MCTHVDSPAEGLVQTFFEMAENRGFFTLPECDEKRARLEFDLACVIEGHIEQGSIEVKDPEDHAAESLFQLGCISRPKPKQVECPLLSKDKRSEFPKGAEVSRADLDRFTLCFACACAEKGLAGAHYIETLNEVRHIVAHGLRGVGHVVPDEHLLKTPERSMWARYEEWKCLAERTCVDENMVKEVVKIAALSRIAS
jgi:hypothetical protein